MVGESHVFGSSVMVVPKGLGNLRSLTPSWCITGAEPFGVLLRFILIRKMLAGLRWHNFSSQCFIAGFILIDSLNANVALLNRSGWANIETFDYSVTKAPYLT